MVQEENAFQTRDFIRDLNFALGIRNRITHYQSGAHPTHAEIVRAANYIVKGIYLFQGKAIPAPNIGHANQPVSAGSALHTRRKRGYLESLFDTLLDWGELVSLLIFAVHLMFVAYYAIRTVFGDELTGRWPTMDVAFGIVSFILGVICFRVYDEIARHGYESLQNTLHFFLATLLSGGC